MVFILLIYAFFGAVLASFLNVVISSSDSFYKTLSRERSVCVSCGKQLVWYELIPIFSWILLWGRCRKCKSKIPIYHIISELVLFILLGLVFYKFSKNGSLLYLVSNSLIILLLYIVSMYDVLKGIIPNLIVIPSVIIILIFRIAQFVFFDSSLFELLSYIGAGVIYFSFFVAANFLSERGLFPGVPERKQGFGWGDSKLAVLIGLVLGIDLTYLSWWITVFAGAVWGVILLIKNKERNMKIAFAPFMSLGVISVILLPESVLNFLEYYLIIYDKLP